MNLIQVGKHKDIIFFLSDLIDNNKLLNILFYTTA